MKNLTIAILMFCVLGFAAQLQAQTDSRFSLEAYKQFLTENEGLSYEDLVVLYPVAQFSSNAPAGFANALYADSVYRYYQLTSEEIAQVENYGFMVTDRVRYTDFGEAFMTVYKRDLPVYISSDAILHALHKSYSAILSTLESEVLYHSLDSLLSALHDQIPAFETTYGSDSMIALSLRDLDLYLTVPLQLLGRTITPFYPENISEVQKVMELIQSENMASYPLFSEVPRVLDFSQFTVRGHYTQSEKLGQFFKAMMWLGRTEFYLKVPDAIPYSTFSEDKKDSIAQRQAISAFLIAKGLSGSEAAQKAINEIDELITFLVGESDNVLIDHLTFIKTATTGFDDLTDLTDIEIFRDFKENLLAEPFASQNILSQILVQDPVNTDDIEPASAFMLLGQRFIIDSYILGNVVFDKTMRRRMLPKSADAMFTLGNNDALPILKNELEQYEYQLNLAGLRYLVDSYEPEYWETSFFNLWLNTIRQLNPPEDRSEFPAFTQTAAWSKKTLNTQMASWAELRHDNLLYAKQSYSGGATCEFPVSYVEPNPDFFESLRILGSISKEELTSFSALDGYMRAKVDNYFADMIDITEKLRDIAHNELDGIENTEAQNEFLSTMLHETTGGCATVITGWYSQLYFDGESDLLKQDYIVADVHTAPFDEQGNSVGWVLHIGTGPLNLAMIVTEMQDGLEYAFVGPVMSYYETVSLNFERYTDDEWAETFENDPVAVRPEFINDYLIASDDPYYDYRGYIPTSVEEQPDETEFPQKIELAQNYPNPFNAGTLISFRIPQAQANQQVSLAIYTIQGQLVQTLVQNRLAAGSYSYRWNPTVASGTYIYRLKVGKEELVQKMVLLK
tara:strand:+ start:25731 stop:28280 length:2550 start_codon:yes stop_codon:yes gene_type:complete